MSGTSGRGGLWVAVLIVLAVLGVAAWLTLRGGGYGEAPAHDHSLTPPTEQPATPPTIGVPESPEPKPLTASPVIGGAPTPALTSTPGVVTAADSAAHVVAKGHVRWAAGKVPPQSDVKLFSAGGEDVDSDATAEDDTFQLSSDDVLEEGWSFGTDSIDVPWKGGTATLLPTVIGNLPEHFPGQPPVVRDLVIGFGPTLTGHVTDKATQQPIAGAEVHVSSTLAPYSGEDLEVDTEADGRYELPLEGVPLTGLIVWCLADDHQASLAGPLDLQPVASPEQQTTQDFALVGSFSVKGHVTDARTQEPINGATITVGSRFQPFVDASNFEITDEAGNFELDAAEVPPEGGWLLITAADCAPTVVPLDKARAPVDVALGAPFIVAGTVLDSAGHGVPSARVQIAFDSDTLDLGQQIFDQADCDTEGRFDTTLELVPQQNAVVIVEQVGKVTFRAKLSEVGHLLAGNRWDVDIRLRDR